MKTSVPVQPREQIVPIKCVLFGILSAEEIKNLSAAEITIPSNRGSNEIEGTPYDLRLGALENNVSCETCGEKNKVCPGHFGHIELVYPCYNPKFIETVANVFKCICIKCFAPRISESIAGAILTLKNSARFKAYKKKAEVMKNCPSCQEALPSFFVDKHTIKIYYEDKKSAIPVTATEAYSLLLQIKPGTDKLLGFNQNLPTNPVFRDEEIEYFQAKSHIHQIKFESLIFTRLPVLPTCARPWVCKGGKLDDDLTDRYNAILKCNQRLRADKEAPFSAQLVSGRKKNGKLSEQDRIKTTDDLTNHIFALIDNSKEKSSKNNNRKQKGLQDRMGGKGGQFQTNVAGKRSDFTARTPIVGAAADIPVGWIGCPEHIAKILSRPVMVTEWNKAHLEELLADGKVNIIARQGFSIVVSEVTAGGTKPFVWKGRPGLQLFDIVHRQLQDGDWGILNRQPTLRLESMQGVQLKILKDIKAFRIPLGTVNAFNADRPLKWRRGQQQVAAFEKRKNSVTT